MEKYNNFTEQTPSGEEQNISEQFFNFLRMMHRYQHLKHHAMGPLGNPHRGQGRILRLLKMQPKISQKELGFLLDMRSQSLGELLNKLEKSGFITRTVSETDRRVMNIELTTAGLDAASQNPSDEREEFFNVLSEEEQQQLQIILQKLSEVLQEKMVGMGDREGFSHSFGDPRADRRAFFEQLREQGHPFFSAPMGHPFFGHGRHHHRHDEPVNDDLDQKNK